ncbi:MAG: elongation factor G [Thermoanaerobaculia bacterium]|nr:elongation factor G [Thermoanaerobaculia bacterium]
MQVDSPEQIRNVAFAGHSDTGKTTLASALLYASGVVNRLNRVEDGNTITDFDPEEVARGMSIGLATCYVPWRKHKVNLLDTPGSGIFGPEARAGIRAADAVALVVNAGSGVQVQTEKMWQYAEEIGQPTMFVLNKLDRENTELERNVEALRGAFGRSVIPLQIPIGKEQGFLGVVDLVEEKAWRFTRDGNGVAQAAEIPADLAGEVEARRSELVEAVAETDEALMEHFFEEGSLGPEELTAGLRRAILNRQIFPLAIGSALHGIGLSTFLDLVVDYLPTPLDRGTYPATNVGGDPITVATTAGEPLSVLVFKTLNDPFTGKISFLRVVSGTLNNDATAWNTRLEDTEKISHLMHLQGKQGAATAKLVTGDIGGVAKLKQTRTGDTLGAKERPVKLGWIPIRPPAMSFAIEPKAKGDEEKISEAVARLMEEDLGLHSERDAQTGELLLSGSGQLHVEIAVAKLKSRSKVELILHPPKVPYRETIRKAADGHGRHKKQTGGRGQFADCKIKIEPLTNGEDFEFIDAIFGGSIPQNFRPAVEKGIQEARMRGFLAGYPMGGFAVRLLDGQYHDVDSSEMAFKIAGSLAYKDAMAKAAATLLEPVMAVEVTTTDEFMGDIMGDLSQRRGRPQGMESLNNQQVIKATVPMAEMLDYAPALRSITQGRSSFTMEFSHYEEVPRQLQAKIIAEAQMEKEE